MNVNKNKYDTVCMLMGYYDKDGNYRETIVENVELKALDKFISEYIWFDHDITVHIAYHKEIRVFAKTLQDIETWIAEDEDMNCVKKLFEDFSRYNDKSVNSEYIGMPFDLKKDGKFNTSANEIF